MTTTGSTLERARQELRTIVAGTDLLDAAVSVLAKPLTPEEAIGTPGRRDFPILIGKERVVEATLGDARGHAFTDAPSEYVGSLRELLELELGESRHRALFVAALNATLRRLDRAAATIHCRDDDPESCGAQIATQLAADADGRPLTVGLVGLNPALAEALVRAFGSAAVRIVDRNPDQIGQERFGVTVGDGDRDMAALIDTADVVLVTGTTLVNGTFDAIWNAIQAAGKRGVVYGVTAAGVAALLGLERMCPCGR
jgi:hypothetical protein